MKLVLIRGLPGAGKSTYAKTHFPWHRHLEADMWFSRTGEYKFNFKELNRAHAWCQALVRVALESGEDVVVTNTFTQDWEFENYMQMAEDVGAEVVVVEMRTQFQNIHGVPPEKIEVMRNRWHDLEDIKQKFSVIKASYVVDDPE